MSFCDRDTFDTSKERKLFVVLISYALRHINIMYTHVAHKTRNFFSKKVYIFDIFLDADFTKF